MDSKKEDPLMKERYEAGLLSDSLDEFFSSSSDSDYGLRRMKSKEEKKERIDRELEALEEGKFGNRADKSYDSSQHQIGYDPKSVSDEEDEDPFADNEKEEQELRNRRGMVRIKSILKKPKDKIGNIKVHKDSLGLPQISSSENGKFGVKFGSYSDRKNSSNFSVSLKAEE